MTLPGLNSSKKSPRASKLPVALGCIADVLHGVWLLIELLFHWLFLFKYTGLYIWFVLRFIILGPAYTESRRPSKRPGVWTEATALRPLEHGMLIAAQLAGVLFLLLLFSWGALRLGLTYFSELAWLDPGTTLLGELTGVLAPLGLSLPTFALAERLGWRLYSWRGVPGAPQQRSLRVWYEFRHGLGVVVCCLAVVSTAAVIHVTLHGPLNATTPLNAVLYWGMISYLVLHIIWVMTWFYIKNLYD